MSDICVVHLVRAANSILAFRRFLESYALNPGGIEHDLLLVYKGFSREKAPDRIPEEYGKILKGWNHRTLLLRDSGYDVGPYFLAARTFGYRYFLFLNSFAIILDENWLKKMHSHASQKGVGLVGCTGSYSSLYSHMVNWKPPIHKDPIHRLRRVKEIVLRRYRRYFPPFPNYHIRTSSFMIRRDLLLRINLGETRSAIESLNATKLDTLRFESGKDSLTAQIFRLGLKALVVGKDGNAYEKEDWPRSDTFRQGYQSNLLVADNQTTNYMNTDLENKRALSRAAWGDLAAPPRI